MPAMTYVEVTVDEVLVSNLDKMSEDDIYVIRLNQRALQSELVAIEAMVTKQDVKRIASGLLKGIVIRVNNLSKGKRSLHLDDLFRVEAIGSNREVFALPGYRCTQGDASDIFGSIDSFGTDPLTKEEVSAMLDDLAVDFEEEVRKKDATGDQQ